MDSVARFTVPRTGKGSSFLRQCQVTVDTARSEILISRFPSFL